MEVVLEVLAELGKVSDALSEAMERLEIELADSIAHRGLGSANDEASLVFITEDLSELGDDTANNTQLVQSQQDPLQQTHEASSICSRLPMAIAQRA